jgi:hypothetical protein
MGIDKFSRIYNCQGKIWGWGQNIIVFHDLLSATMYNFQYSKFIYCVNSTKFDLFYPSIELDYFN